MAGCWQVGHKPALTLTPLFRPKSSLHFGTLTSKSQGTFRNFQVQIPFLTNFIVSDRI